MIFTEKTNFQISLTTLIVMIIFMIGSISTAVTWKVQVEYSIDTNTTSIKAIEEVNTVQFGLIGSNGKKTSEQEVFMAEIRTDLKWIITTLEEINNRR